MKQYIFLLLISLFVTTGLSAQFGISAYYSTIHQQENTYELYETKSGIMGNGFSIGLDYWFRLKNKRVEFTPEVNFTRHNLRTDLSQVLAEDLRENIYSLYFNTNIYPFDFNTDCDCPTFSKQNDTFKKGFFIQLSPQASYRESVYKNDIKQDGISFGAALGLGLDIGITKLITITPIVRYNYHFGVEMVDWSDANTPLLVNESDRGTVTAGIRLGVRFDGKRF